MLSTYLMALPILALILAPFVLLIHVVARRLPKRWQRELLGREL